VDSSLLQSNEFILLQVREDNQSPLIGIQSTIRVQHVIGTDYNSLWRTALDLGKKVASLSGRYSVRDKMTSADICSEYGLPHKFDGPMHPFGMHVDTYNGRRCDPFHYKGTDDFRAEIKAFADVCLPIMNQRFHFEYAVMQRAMHSFGEISPSYLGGSDGISLSINVSHNFANSSHYDSIDFGPSIVLWVLDDDACNNCDQYLVFNNVKQRDECKQPKCGVMIKISDGMLMSFDGSSLRHGTTIRRHSSTGVLCPSGNVFGIHFGLSLSTLSSFRRLRLDQYVKVMNIIPRKVTYKSSGNEQNNKARIGGKRRKTNQIQYRKKKRKKMNRLLEKCLIYLIQKKILKPKRNLKVSWSI